MKKMRLKSSVISVKRILMIMFTGAREEFSEREDLK